MVNVHEISHSSPQHGNTLQYPMGEPIAGHRCQYLCLFLFCRGSMSTSEIAAPASTAALPRTSKAYAGAPSVTVTLAGTVHATASHLPLQTWQRERLVALSRDESRRYRATGCRLKQSPLQTFQCLSVQHRAHRSLSRCSPHVKVNLCW